MKPRLSLASLMMLVLFVGLCLAVFKELNPSPLWASSLFTLTVSIQLVAVLGAIYRRGRVRAFCVGFALFGASTLLLNFGPFLEAAVRPPPLLPRKLLDGLFLYRVGANNPLGVDIKYNPVADEGYYYYSAGFQGGIVTSERTLQVGISLVSLFAGLCGGVTARYFHATGANEREYAPN